MNTGAGDATDLAWKLAGTLHGWGGAGAARRLRAPSAAPSASRNVAASRRAAAGRGGMASGLAARDRRRRRRGRGGAPRRARRGRRPRAALEQRAARHRARLPLSGLAADRGRRGGRARSGRLRLRARPRARARGCRTSGSTTAARCTTVSAPATRCCGSPGTTATSELARRLRRASALRSPRSSCTRRPRTRCSRATARCWSAPTCTSSGAVTGPFASRSAWRPWPPGMRTAATPAGAPARDGWR